MALTCPSGLHPLTLGAVPGVRRGCFPKHTVLCAFCALHQKLYHHCSTEQRSGPVPLVPFSSLQGGSGKCLCRACSGESCSWPSAACPAVLTVLPSGSSWRRKGSRWMLRAVRDAQGSITVTQGGRQHGPSAAGYPCKGKTALGALPCGWAVCLCCQGPAGCYTYSSGGFWKENGLAASLTLAL